MIFPKVVWVNGKWLDPRRPAISVFDRGFMSGEGVFETLRVYAGKPFRYEDHWDRLRRSASCVRIRIPASRDGLRRAFAELLRRNRLTEAVVRVTLTRGVGPRGYDPRPCRAPTLVMAALPVPPRPGSMYRRGVRVALSRTVRLPRSVLDPAIKSTNNLNNAFAYWDAMKAGALEAVMLNAEGFLTEGTASNLFFVAGDELRTPSLECGLLAGVTRSVVLELARKEGMRVAEGRYRPRDLLQAREVFLTGTTLEVLPVTRVADQAGRVHLIGSGSPGPRAPQLLSRYRERVTRETGRTF